MGKMSVDQILQAITQLSPAERSELSKRLRAAGPERQAVPAGQESLKGKFSRSGIQTDAEEVEAYLHSLNTEWQQDLDDLVS